MNNFGFLGVVEVLLRVIIQIWIIHLSLRLTLTWIRHIIRMLVAWLVCRWLISHLMVLEQLNRVDGVGVYVVRFNLVLLLNHPRLYLPLFLLKLFIPQVL